MALAAECVNNCNFVRSYFGLMTDAPHICFELSVDALTGILLYPLIKRGLRAYRDRIHQEIDEEHGVVHTERPAK
jgi:hypothetical protein